MYYEDNDTRNANEQNAQQTNGKAKNGLSEETKKKVAVGTATTAAVGAAAVYGASVLMDDDDVQPVAVAEEESEPAETPVEHTETHAEQPEAQAVVETAHHDSANGKTSSNLHETKHEDVKNERHEAAFMKDNKVEIENIETSEMGGQTVHVAHGTVNGHAAVMVDDGEGHVAMAAVDQNDNGNIDDGEVVDLTAQNITMGDVADRLTVHTDEPIVTPVVNDHEVEVIAVVNDVEMGGHTVDVAAVAIDDEPVLLIDATQNGEVDVMIADENHNGSFADDTPTDVSSRHIAMPTEADVVGSGIASTDDGMPDYSNDSDTTLYEA